MKLTTRILTRWATAMVVAVLAPLAHAAIVTNGDFESGLTGWTVTTTGTKTQCSVGAALGGFFGLAATVNCEHGQKATLGQTLGTTSGFDYDILFWLKDGTGNTLSVLWGTDILSLGVFSIGAKLNGFTPYSITRPATGASTLLEFDFDFTRATTTSTAFLDSVSVDQGACSVGQVCAVPEPGSLLLVGAALAAGAAASRKKKI